MIESLVGTIHRRNTLQHKIFQQRLQLFGISFQVLCYVRLSKIRSGLRFTSKQDKITAILDFCSIPRSRKEIQTYLGLTGRNNFYDTSLHRIYK